MGKWVKKKLGDLGFSFSGLSGKTIDDFGEGKPFIPYMNIFTNGKINSKQLEYVRIAENERQNKVEQGDWFFTTSSETPDDVGMTSVLVEDIGEAYLNSFCFGFRLYDKSEFDPEFVSYLFRSVDLRKKISLFAQGSTRYNLPKQQMFEKLYISYPSSLSEQRRIASILSSADKVIDSTQKLIAKYKSIKQGMMEDLLKPKEGWKKVKLGEVGDFYVGGDVDKNSYSPYPTIDCKFPIYANALVREGIYGYSSKYEFDKEAVTITGRGDVGKVFYRAPYFSTIIRLITLIPNDSEINVRYLSYAMSRINFIIESTGVPQLTAPQAKMYEVFIPDFSEQCRIASILSSIDKKIESEEKTLEKYKNIKKGLMEKLLKEEEV